MELTENIPIIDLSTQALDEMLKDKEYTIECNKDGLKHVLNLEKLLWELLQNDMGTELKFEDKEIMRKGKHKYRLRIIVDDEIEFNRKNFRDWIPATHLFDEIGRTPIKILGMRKRKEGDKKPINHRRDYIESFLIKNNFPQEMSTSLFFIKYGSNKYGFPVYLKYKTQELDVGERYRVSYEEMTDVSTRVWNIFKEPAIVMNDVIVSVNTLKLLSESPDTVALSDRDMMNGKKIISGIVRYDVNGGDVSEFLANHRGYSKKGIKLFLKHFLPVYDKIMYQC